MGFFVLGTFIPYYGLCVAIGIAAALALGAVLCRRRALDGNGFLLVAAYALLFGFAGAKLLYVAVSFKSIDFARVFRSGRELGAFVGAGFVFYGGLLGGLCALPVVRAVHGVPVGAYLPVLAPCLALAHACGRAGCALAGCCHGVCVRGGLHVTYAHSLVAPNGVPLFPVQATESACLLLLTAVLLFLLHTGRGRCVPYAYLLSYACLRFLLEFLRGDGARGSLGPLSVSQVLSLLVAAATLLLLARGRGKAAAVTDECATRYPVLLVHGLGFRDRRVPCYWGRIPRELEARGAAVFYGEQDAWCTVEEGAAQLKGAVERALLASGAEKVNIIAHSRGGLDARYLASRLGMAGAVASVTMVGTPNHGSVTVDRLRRAPAWCWKLAAAVVNGWFRLWGDRKPDFAGALRGLGAERMERFNREVPDAPGVLYQSIAGSMGRATADLLLWLPFLVVRAVEGANDGLVTEDSARWGTFRGVLVRKDGRGVSHAQEVGALRANPRLLPQESLPAGADDLYGLYVALARELKARGL